MSRGRSGRRAEAHAGPGGAVRRCGRAVVTGGMVGLLVVVAAGRAEAHTELESVDPGSQSVQSASPRQVTLTFSEPVNRKFTLIRVTGPSGASVGSGAPVVDQEVVRQPLAPLSAPGRYLIAFRTVSVDGHVVTGSREFTFKPVAGGPTAAATAAPGLLAAPVLTQGTESESSGPLWTRLLLGLAVLVMAAGAGLGIRRARHRAG